MVQLQLFHFAGFPFCLFFKLLEECSSVKSLEVGFFFFLSSQKMFCVILKILKGILVEISRTAIHLPLIVDGWHCPLYSPSSTSPVVFMTVS